MVDPIAPPDCASVRWFDPEQLQPARGFSHVALARGRTLVSIAGQTPVDRDLEVVGRGDLGAQTRAAMTNLWVALQAAGAGWGHVVRRTVFTTRPTEFLTISEVIREVTGMDAQPPQSLIGVAGLVRPEFLIEIEATAVI